MCNQKTRDVGLSLVFAISKKGSRVRHWCYKKIQSGKHGSKHVPMI